MAQGTISKFFSDRGFGFIRPATGGQDVWFHITVVQGATASDLMIGAKVDYETEVARDGRTRAKSVRLVATGRAVASAGQSTSQPERTGAYRFLNPYNFVRPLEARNRKASPSLGKSEPPPHDRYLGWTGRIKCKLTATTPLFVSDSHSVREEIVSGKAHRHYRFFQNPDGNVVIPATTLRGPIRSVFEAATNSCFAHFADRKRLSYHLPPGDALRLVPGRVREIKQDGEPSQWELDLLPGTTPISPDYRPSGPQYAAWIHVYKPLWASQTVPKAPETPYARRAKLSLDGWHHKDQCWAVVEPVQHPLRRFEFWNVVALAKSEKELPPHTGEQRVFEGYLCLNNQNIENKHDERFFFRLPTNKTGSQPLDLTQEVRDRYNELIEDYRERHRDAAAKRKHPEEAEGKEPAYSRFILAPESAAKLSNGDLVYALVGGSGNELEVKDIVPVSVPRLGYRHTIGDLLTPGVSVKCSHYDHLCPACRVFGWVGEEEEAAADTKTKLLAYAGRVRFSQAQRVAGPAAFDATLAILSSPKPTTTRFYLTPKKGKPQGAQGLDDARVDYDSGMQRLRGRKFYRHQGSRISAAEYSSVGGKQTDQNRTVHGVQKEGTVFEFSVDFENLNDVELGALLWSLEMEGWHHRLGFGKPLGFGSATIEVVGLEIMTPTVRYAGLAAGWTDALDRKARWVEGFKTAMAERYGEKFESLANVRDLRALLADAPPLPVHYPRPAEKPLPDGKNFEWFVGNKRSGRDAGPRLLLALADEDVEGLPLIDKYGDVER